MDAGIFHPTRITHVVFVTRDYEAMLGFYRDQIGLDLLHGGAGGPFSVLGGTCGTKDLILFRAQNGWPIGLHHMGFRVHDETELVTSVSCLAGSNWEMEREIDLPARRCIHVRDPDGLRVQFYVDRKDVMGELGEMDPDTALFVS